MVVGEPSAPGVADSVEDPTVSRCCTAPALSDAHAHDAGGGNVSGDCACNSGGIDAASPDELEPAAVARVAEGAAALAPPHPDATPLRTCAKERSPGVFLLAEEDAPSSTRSRRRCTVTASTVRRLRTFGACVKVDSTIDSKRRVLKTRGCRRTLW